ncbi:MAG: sensor histidine kinase [Acidimicrobiales bacterium]
MPVDEPPAPAPGLRPASSPPRRRRRRLGTTTRLLLVHGLALSAVLGVVLLQVVRDFTSHYQTTTVIDLSEEVLEYVHAASLRPSGQGLEAFSRYYLQTHLLPSNHVVLVALPHEPVLGSTGSLGLARSPAVARLLARAPAHSELTTVSLGLTSYMVLASPIRMGGKTVGSFVAAADLARLAAARNQVVDLASIEAAIALLVALASAYLLLRRVLRTVGAVTDAAVEASHGDLDRRLGEGGPDDEVGRLARTFDDMLDRISATVVSQRRLLSDVSHQLRTPLTVARGHLEVLRRAGVHDAADVAETTEVVIDELAHMATLVDRLLMLGRSLEPDFIELDRVDLRAFMADLFEAVRVLDDRRWSLSPVPDVVILADEAKLRGALLNLVDNAVKATVAGDAIELQARANDEVVIAVVDTGRGIAPDLREMVFERFARPGATNDRGSGLGLAIVKAVAEGHGGRVELDSELGRGTRVNIVLPPSCLLANDLSSVERGQ